MKNSADFRGCYPPRPSASVDNTLLDLQNSSYPTQPLNSDFPARIKYQLGVNAIRNFSTHPSMLQLTDYISTADYIPALKFLRISLGNSQNCKLFTCLSIKKRSERLRL